MAHTPGAIKAARIIADELIKLDLPIPTRYATNSHDLATIIDRETGAKEMLDVLKNVAISFRCQAIKNPKGFPVNEPIWSNIRHAIAKFR